MRARDDSGAQKRVKRGDIYYVIGGAAVGSEQEADRPAIVVSNDTGNRYAPIVEVVYLTTRKKVSLPTRVFIGSAERPSVALCEQIVTVSKNRLVRRINRVTPEEMRRIDAALTKSLGIHKQTGGNAMQITMLTPFGEMKFDLPPEKATDLVQRAFQYAAGREPEQNAPLSATTEPPTPQKAPEPTIKPQSRVERMFGDFRAAGRQGDGKLSAAGRREPEAYKGFLIAKCEHCGKIKGFCAKQPITQFLCECGKKTELHDLKMVHLKCKCGSQYNYRTNMTEEVFDFPCLKCGNPVDLELNKRGDTYVTIGE